MAITLLKPFNLDSTGNYTFDTLTANIKTDSLMYANGVPYTFGGAVAGSNTQVQFNDGNSFGGNANFTFDKTTSKLTVSFISGDGSNISNIAGANVTGQVGNASVASTVYTNSQPNITSVGTLTSLTVSGNTSLGNISNISITGGAANYVIQTDGNGNLSWVAQQTANFSGYATESYVGNAIANLVNSAPTVLDTLGELSNALGNDANFSTTLTNSLANKLNTSDFISTANNWGANYLPNYSGNLTAGNANLGNAVSANFFIGNGSLLTGLPAGYTNSDVANYLPTHTGNISANNFTVTNTFTAGTITTSGSGGNISGANVISANSFTATGNITASNANLGNIVTANTFTATGNITANYFIGNGSQLTGLPASYSNNDVANYLPNYTGNISANNLTVTNTFTAGTITTSGSGGNISGANVIIANLFQGNANSLSNIPGANVTGFVPNANVANTAYNVSGANVSGQVANATVAGTVYTNAQPNITSVGNLTSLDVTGNVSANFFIGNGSQLTGLPGAYTDANVANYLPNYTGNISANYFIGNGSLLTGLPAAYSNNDVANYLPTYTGNVSANYFIGNGASLTSIAGANVTGFVPNANVANTAFSVSGANVSGEVSNALVAGTVYTNAQPNITSVGTLTGLTVSGNATITGNLTISGNTTIANVTTVNISDPIVEQGGNANGALTTNDGKDRGTLLHYYTTAPIDAFMGWDSSNAEFAFGSNVSVSNEVVAFNSFGNLRAGTYFGDGSQLTGVNAVSAQIVTSNAQPNITSVGTLTSLSVTGTITAGNVYANVGTIGANNLTGVLTTASQPNITTVGSLLGLSVLGNAAFTGASVNLGAVSNLKIDGGSNNFVLKTDGAGNLSWVAQPTSSTIAVDNFTGNGVQTTFTLSTTPSSVNNVLVNINGASQLREAYSLSGANLVFVAAPPNTSKIEVTTLSLTAGGGGGGGGGSLATLSDVSLSSPATNQVLRYNGSTWINSTISAYIYSAVSANTTLSPGYRYLVDTSAANLTLTLPSSPTLGQEVGIIDATGTSATHAITVNGNGANIMGNSSSLNVSTNNAAFSLVYYNAARGWILTNV
jgi:peroxiredoxin